MKVVVRSVAEAEIAETWDYYEEIRPSLAEDFLEKVAAALARAADHPHAFALVHRDLRRVRLTRFPHGLIYRVVGDTLVVVACTHPRQNPTRWERRR